MVGVRAGRLAGRWRRTLTVFAWTTLGMLSSFWLFGAELVAPTPTWSQRSQAFAPGVVSPVSEEFRRRIDTATSTIPVSVWQSLANEGWKVQLAEFVVDAAPTLVGEQPRGWPRGLTWEHTDAVNLPQRRVVVVAEKRRNRQGEVVPAWRIEGVFRHELGHAFDQAGGEKSQFQSSHPQFIAAYLRDCGEIPADDRPMLAYYLQEKSAGRQEAFAEAFAIVLGGGSDPSKRESFERAFPRVVAYLKELLTDDQMIAQAPTTESR